MSQNAKPQVIYLLVYEGVQLLDIAGPSEVFMEANQLGMPYIVRYIGETESVCTSTGLVVACDLLPENLNDIHTLLVPGAREAALLSALESEALLTWLKKAARRAKRVISVCSGAFFLGRLGLLSGRTVTTHWAGLTRLQHENPDANVLDDSLYTQSEDLWTSAGVLSGVDMALAIVRQDLGAHVALKVARNLVAFICREGGQSQFSGPINMQMRVGRGDLLNLVNWLDVRLDQVVSLEDMADYMNMSVRTLHRKCQIQLSLSPAVLLSQLRMERARSLLLDSTTPIDLVGQECGFANGMAFSKAFSRRYGVSPKQYRKGFEFHEYG